MFQVRKPRPREERSLTQGHTAGRQQRLNSHTGPSDSRACAVDLISDPELGFEAQQGRSPEQAEPLVRQLSLGMVAAVWVREAEAQKWAFLDSFVGGCGPALGRYFTDGARGAL